jgi:hypothetical protein
VADAAEAAGDATGAVAALERLQSLLAPADASTLKPRLAKALAKVAGRGPDAVAILLEGVEDAARPAALVALAGEWVCGEGGAGDPSLLLASCLDALAAGLDPDTPSPASAALVASLPVASALIARLASVATAAGEAEASAAAARAAALGRALLLSADTPAEAACDDGPLPACADPLVTALDAWHTVAARFSTGGGGCAPLGDPRFRSASAALASLAGPGRPVATESVGLLAWWAMLGGEAGVPATGAARARATAALSARFGSGAAPPAVCVALARLALADGRPVDAAKAARHALRAVRARAGADASGEGVLAARALAARAALATGDASGAATEAGKALAAAGGLGAVLATAPLGCAAREAARAAARAARALGKAGAVEGDTKPDEVVAALASTPGAEAWARADYGRLCLEAGDMSAATAELEAAVAAASTGAGGVSDGEAAAMRLAAGDAHWAAWAAARLDADAARAAARHWLGAAAVVDGPAAAPAFAALARFYAPGSGPPPGDRARADRCAQRAAALDPSHEAGVTAAVRGLLHKSAFAGAEALARAATDAAPASAWAWRALAAARAGGRDTAGEVAALQSALRSDPASTADWVRLCRAYVATGRPTAAARVGERAVATAAADGGGGGERAAATAAHAALAQAALAAGDPRRALKAVGQAGPSPAVAATEAEAALVLAAEAAKRGEVSAAVAAAQRAAVAASAVGRGGPLSLLAAKLSGDASLALATVTASAAPAQAAARAAARAFARAVHAAPWRAGGWGDLGASLVAHVHALRMAGTAQTPPLEAGAHALVSTAERALRAGLRADPASSRLWAALGALPLLGGGEGGAGQAVKPRREYALRRALALDPGCGGAWASLIRLYASSHPAEGAAPAANAALVAARARVPADPAVWAAAGFAARQEAVARDVPLALAAAAGLDAYAHALTMDGGGASAEALLAVAEAAGRAGEAGRAVVESGRAVGVAPNCSGARIALGAALLAGGGARSAALAAVEFKAAAALEAGGNGRGLPAAPAWLVSPAGLGAPPASVVAAVGLARALAVLGVQGMPVSHPSLESHPAEVLAAARAGGGCADALGDLLASPATPPTTRFQAARALVGLRITREGAAAGVEIATAAAAALAAGWAADGDLPCPALAPTRSALAAAALAGGATPRAAAELAASATPGVGLTPAEAADVLTGAADAGAAGGAAPIFTARLLARAAHAAPADHGLRAAAAASAGLPGLAFALAARSLDPASADRALAAAVESAAAATLALASRATPATPALSRRALHAEPWRASLRAAVIEIV